MNKKHNLCKLLQINYPIIQGGMAWISYYNLTAAICKAGALGILTSVADDLDFVQSEIRKMKKLNLSFGINIMMQSPYVNEIAQLIIDEKVPIVTTGGGNPQKYIDKWHAAGVVVIPVVSSVSYARIMERAGADAIIAEGMESGGHIGNATTLSLLPQICEKVNIPVIAAGGFYDHKSLLTAYLLGAQGIQLGTRFLIAKECNIHQNYKNKILKSYDNSTIIVGNRTGHPVRALKSNFTNAFLQKENNKDISNNELQEYMRGKFKIAVEEGDEETGCFLAGQIAGRIQKEETVEEIITDIIHGNEKF